MRRSPTAVNVSTMYMNLLVSTFLMASAPDTQPDTVVTKPAQLRWDSVYFMLGASPATTIYRGGFHPGMRYDMELGLDWDHRTRDRSMTVGLEGHLLHFFERPTPGGGADVVVSAQLRRLYLRAGAGVMTGIPRRPDVKRFSPAVGGLAGLGLQVGDGDFSGRVGVDYDVRVDRGFGVNHTVLLVARFAWGV